MQSAVPDFDGSKLGNEVKAEACQARQDQGLTSRQAFCEQWKPNVQARGRASCWKSGLLPCAVGALFLGTGTWSGSSARRCTAKTDSTGTTSLLPPGRETLKLKKGEEKERRRKLKAEAKHETRMRELDRRWKAGERLSSPDGDAWREWKSVSLGLPEKEERMSKRKKRKKRKKRLPSQCSSSSCSDTTLWATVPLSLFVVWCAVFPSFVDTPEMLCIMVGIYQKDSSLLFVV